MTGKQLSTLGRFDVELNTMRGQLEMVLPDHLTVDRLARTLRSAVINSPKLLECNRKSLWRAVQSAAVFGLEIDGRQSALIPFGNQAQWIPMVAGLVTIAYNAGFVVQGEVVRAKDDLQIEHGINPILRHKKALGATHDHDNEVIGAYAVAWSRSMRPIFEYMDLPDLIRVRDGSKGYQYAKRNNKPSVWIQDFRGMARKTPVRAICNHLPWQVQRAVEVEDRFDEGGLSWATKAEDGAITVDYAEFTDEPPRVIEGGTTQHTVNKSGDDVVSAEDHQSTMEAEGARMQASGAQGRLDE